MTDEENQFGLVMPFVVCDDHGGPFDGGAFVAGWVCGQLSKDLETLARSFTEDTNGEATVEQYMDPRLLPQVDLIAMQHGFSMSHEPWDEHPDERTLVTLTRTQATDR